MTTPKKARSSSANLAKARREYQNRRAEMVSLLREYLADLNPDWPANTTMIVRIKRVLEKETGRCNEAEREQ